MDNAGDAGRPKPRTRAKKAAPEPPRPANDIDLGAGTWRAAIADEELRRAYPDADFDDGGWEPVTVPSHWRSTPAFADADGPVLYRTAFANPAPFGPGADRADEADEPRRSWLMLDGLFYTSDVWLDGSYLGDTEGYFFPHSFEVSDALAAQAEHTLALEVSCRRESDLSAKRNLTGTFQHGDLVPPDWNPGGIWRPVRLEQSGAVRITHFRALCRDASTEQATVFVRAVLDTIEARTVELVTTIVPCNQGAEAAFAEGFEHRQTQPLAQGENRVEWTVPVPEPRLWWPHALGEQPLYEVIVEVCAPADRGELVSDRRTVRMGLRSVSVDDWIFSINGERLFLKGANYGPTTMALADATASDMARDLALAKEANLDFLRVHAYVSMPELYDAADDAGVLIWQDMPLQWGYHRSIRKQARRQARELVDLLAHHPSIFVWCGHNEPLAIDPDPDPDGAAGPRRRSHVIGRELAGQLLPSWNKSVLDHSIKKVIEKADASRPVIPHSGVLPHLPQLDGTDSHLFWGWNYGGDRTFDSFLKIWPRLARFVSELGAQAFPAVAPYLEPERWPDLDWERLEERFGFQQALMEEHVPAAGHETFAGYVEATQRYQADLLRHQIETLRRIKYRPCGGFAQFHFADASPGVSCSVLDHDRVPKLGYEALRSACRPVIVVADRLPAEVVPGATFSLDIHVVNETRIAQDDMLTHVNLFSASAQTDEEGHEPTRPWQTWSWHGEISPDSCSRIGTLELVVPNRLGPLVVRLELRGPDALVADNRYESLVVRG
jgi:beta-mannosidase